MAGQRGDHGALAQTRKQGFLREALLEERARSVVGCGTGAWLPAWRLPLHTAEHRTQAAALGEKLNLPWTFRYEYYLLIRVYFNCLLDEI